MNNRICDVLDIEKPIIQGPMAWISTAPLAAAVSNAGGLGVLGVGFAPLDFVKQQIMQTRQLTDKPFAINTIMIPENLEAITEVIREMLPPVIYADSLQGLKSDLCSKYFSLWHSFDCKVIVKASCIEDAINAEQGGADIIIVKGWEGGGHVTFEATTVLVPQAVDQLHVPVVAAGGIADGRGMAAAIALGAEGVEMGTVFMAASEASIHLNVKESVIKAGDMSTIITGYSTDEPCRQIKNKLADEMTEIEALNTKAVAAEKLRPVAESSLKKAMMDGDMEMGAVMVGQIVPLITSIKPVKEIIDGVIRETKERLEIISKYKFN
ncbi:nitronate monooxygenase [Lacrimispora sp. 38-1]|uniref:nitronate monooxygenase n=1 Tax=Lacrimispora sp. 38-1 TaxID=3125778 RepID=UPI003CEB074A